MAATTCAGSWVLADMLARYLSAGELGPSLSRKKVMVTTPKAMSAA
ncbi:hypothetical protein ES703_118387 [subsurface metagenome]